MSKQINITVEADGSVQIETTGFKGKSCQDITKSFEQALGVVKGNTFKPEFYQHEERSQQVKQ
ncbi:MAG TPA: DUF2997 domain-containing protein [Verrucomicrobiae bacterium]|nr:DUF2997 domain-containing protein [Verrucomicrobiae bacterium]